MPQEEENCKDIKIGRVFRPAETFENLLKMSTQVAYYVLLSLLYNTVGIHSFSGQQCLQAHNKLRSKHSKTEPLKYSKELEKEAKAYADLLAKNDGDQSDV